MCLIRLMLPFTWLKTLSTSLDHQLCGNCQTFAHLMIIGVFSPTNAAIHVAQNAINFFGTSAMWYFPYSFMDFWKFCKILLRTFHKISNFNPYFSGFCWPLSEAEDVVKRSQPQGQLKSPWFSISPSQTSLGQRGWSKKGGCKETSSIRSTH